MDHVFDSLLQVFAQTTPMADFPFAEGVDSSRVKTVVDILGGRNPVLARKHPFSLNTSSLPAPTTESSPEIGGGFCTQQIATDAVHRKDTQT